MEFSTPTISSHYTNFNDEEFLNLQSESLFDGVSDEHNMCLSYYSALGSPEEQISV